jgi:hypothetical protein
MTRLLQMATAPSRVTGDHPEELFDIGGQAFCGLIQRRFGLLLGEQGSLLSRLIGQTGFLLFGSDDSQDGLSRLPEPGEFGSPDLEDGEFASGTAPAAMETTIGRVHVTEAARVKWEGTV